MQFNDFEKIMIEDSSEILRAIAHPLRVSILNFIETNQPIKVFAIHSELKLDQSLASQHLKILREAKLVITERKGKNIYYTIDHPRMNHIIKQILIFDKLSLARRKQKR